MLKTNDDALMRIMSNLVLNAIQAMPEGGELTITAILEGNRPVVSIADTGQGIPEDIRPHLFKPLFTTKPKGQGFGLAVVKKLTEDLRIEISYVSTVRKGTTFFLKFPQTIE